MQEIELDWTFTSYAAKLNINKNKNRYINIIPCTDGLFIEQPKFSHSLVCIPRVID